MKSKLTKLIELERASENNSLKSNMFIRRWHDDTRAAILAFDICVAKHFKELQTRQEEATRKEESFDAGVFNRYLCVMLPKILDELLKVTSDSNVNADHLDELALNLSKRTFISQYLAFIFALVGLAIMMGVFVALLYTSPTHLYTVIGIFGYFALTLSSVFAFVIVPSQPSTILTKAKNAIHDELELESILTKLDEKGENFKNYISEASSLNAKECSYYAKIAVSEQKFSGKSILFFHPERWLEPKEKSEQRSKIEGALITMKSS